MANINARFAVGQIVKHILFGYRGVITDVDMCFQGSDDWYDKMALSRPPKDEPWYHLLVHDAVHHAYVAESQLELDTTGEVVEHPELDYFFADFQNGVYITHRKKN